MKLIVLEPFIDAETLIPYNVGCTYTTDDADRAEELKAAGYVDGNIKRKKADKPAADGTPTDDTTNKTNDKNIGTAPDNKQS